MEEHVGNIKKYLTSYIETLQTCLNTTNPDFLLLLVKSTPTMQEKFLMSFNNEKNGDDFDEKMYDNEKKLLFQQMICGMNDLDETIETSKQVELHKNLTQCYFNFVRKQIRDFVPKRIQYQMVNAVLDNFELHLRDDVFTPYVINRSLEQALQEEEGSCEERESAEKLLEAINKGLENMIVLQCNDIN